MYVCMYVCMYVYIYIYMAAPSIYIYIYIAGCFSEPQFTLQSHETYETCENAMEKRNENRTARRLRQWGSVTHPQNEVAFSFFCLGGAVRVEKKTVSGNAFSSGEIFFCFFQRVPFLFVLSGGAGFVQQGGEEETNKGSEELEEEEEVEEKEKERQKRTR